MRSSDIAEKSGQIVIRGLIVLVRLWQTLFSAWMAPSCRFVPSCSEYSIQALHEHGLVKGCWLTICRLSRCHPFGGSGLDEVPACSHDHHRPPTDSGATTREDKSNGLNSI